MDRPRLGVDLVAVARVERLSARWGERFLRRVFTPAELAALPRRRRHERLAGLIAAKEALIKAHGRFIPWREIEVGHLESGEPRFTRLPSELRDKKVELSLSHAAGLAIAVVLIS